MSVYKDKKTGKWYCIFRFTDWTGKRKQVKKSGFEYKRQALDYERNYIEQKNNQINIKFENLYASYMEDCTHRLKKTTLKRKKCIFRVHILPYFGKMPINEIKPAHIRSWQNEILKADFTPNHQRNLNAEITAIFNFAMGYYGLMANPAKQCAKIGNTKPKSFNFWTKEQFESFISTVEDITYKLIFNLLFYSGMRIGELLALTAEDIDLVNGNISINKNYVRLDKRAYITSTKTNKSNRVVTIPKWLCDEIKDYIERLYGYDQSERLFPYRGEYIHRIFKALQVKAGMERLKVHDLRHSHASLLIELGFNTVLIRERLGHESITTTVNTYGHLYPNKQAEISQALEKD